MKKKFSVYIVTLLVLFITNVKAENAITFLNLEYVLNNSVSGKVILNEINLLKKTNEENFNNLGVKIKKKEQDLLNKKNILSEEDFNINLSNLKKEISEFNQKRNKQISVYENTRKEMLDNYLKKITPIIQDYIIKNSISIVLNQKDIFIGNKKNDITLDIVKLVDQKIKWIN